MLFRRRFIGDFKPHKVGLKKVLGDLEAEIMEYMWGKEQATVRDVYEHLRLKREIAYTTVMTVMSRLATKKLLNKEQKGMAYVYSPALSREEFTRLVAGEIIDSLLEEFAEPALSHLVDRLSKEDEEKINQLEELIKNLRKKKR